MRESERTVAVKDVQGRREYLRVPQGFLTAVGEKHYLPVGVVYEDREKGLVLVELSQEGECGSSRLWVRTGDLIHYRNGNFPAHPAGEGCRQFPLAAPAGDGSNVPTEMQAKKSPYQR
jgi:hypothetical protein